MTTQQLISGALAIEARAPEYLKGHSGDDGYCDCIGLIIGACSACGQRWPGIHGSNWAERYAMASAADTAVLSLGDVVYKWRDPDEDGYGLPDKYRQGGSQCNGDLRDYYHVGLVIGVSPLCILHCTSPGGCTRDSKIGRWRRAGRLKYVTGGETTVAETTMRVTAASGSSVRMRKAPSTAADVLDKVPIGSTVTRYETDGTWSRIMYGSTMGYMMDKYLTTSAASSSVEARLAAVEAGLTAVEARLTAIDGGLG